MDAKDLKKILAGFCIAGLVAVTTVVLVGIRIHAGSGTIGGSRRTHTRESRAAHTSTATRAAHIIAPVIATLLARAVGGAAAAAPEAQLPGRAGPVGPGLSSSG